jgi:HAD superfamily hydrolase (TIGR01509 family)
MIKYIIFDLDGVLVETKDIHFKALNKALIKTKKKYQISYTDHLKRFDGLPTKEKLSTLVKEKKISKNEIKNINDLKQRFTLSFLEKDVKFDKKIYDLFSKLSKNYSLAIATNSINATLNTCIKNLKIKKFLKFYIGTDDVKNNKPHPEIYLRCLVENGFKPHETIIVEDSYVGRLAAKDACCNLLPIKFPSELTYSKIINHINNLIKLKKIDHQNTWDDPEMNILIPMAGAGSRFEKAGYTFPKPLIEIHGKPMIQWVIESINVKGKFIFLIQKNHQKKFNVRSLLKALQPDCKIIEIDGLTEGAACTTLLAKKYINNDKPLLIANSDQYIEWNSSKSFYKFVTKKVDGAILTFDSLHPKWSFAKTNKLNQVTKVAEKEVISNHATAGIYYWLKGSDYVSSAEEMIKKDIRVNNEFYVCPVFNIAIKNKKNFIIEEIDKMWGLGTPEDLNYFLQNYKYDI